MLTLRHFTIAVLYTAAAAALAYCLPRWFPAIDPPLAVTAGLLAFLTAALLHEVTVRAGRQGLQSEQVLGLHRAHGELEDELTWTRREVKAVREALEAVVRHGGPPKGARPAGHGGARRLDPGLEEVMTEVKMLRSIVAKITENAPPTLTARDGDPTGGRRGLPLPLGPATRPGEEPGNSPVLELIREALRDDRIDLTLQPIVQLPQRKRLFYECFSRLIAQDGTILMPDQYISVAESAGLITAIDNMLLFRCIQMVRRIQRKQHSIGFFCNLSRHTLSDEDFFGDFVEFLESNAELAPNLIFEFAQGDLSQMDEPEFAALARLRRLGSRLSLDQVESLEFDAASLARRGVGFVKVDAALLRNGSAQAQERQMIRLNAGLGAHDIHLIVEKIEDEERLMELLDYGAAFGQGYLFGQPRPAKLAD